MDERVEAIKKRQADEFYFSVPQAKEDTAYLLERLDEALRLLRRVRNKMGGFVGSDEIAVADLIAAAKDILQYESDCHGECAADESNETCWWRKMRIAIKQIEAQKDAGSLNWKEGSDECM